MDARSALDLVRSPVSVSVLRRLNRSVMHSTNRLSVFQPWRLIAYNLRWTNGIICPLLDARRSEVYGAIFEGGTEWQRLSEDLCLPT